MHVRSTDLYLPYDCRGIKRSFSHLVCQCCMSCKQLMPYWQCTKQLSKCQNKSLWSLKKKSALKSKKVQKLKKREESWLRLGLNPQLSWLNTVYLRAFDRNLPQLLFFSLHLCLQRAVKCLQRAVKCLQCAVKNKWKQISISNHHSQVPRWRVFNFAHVPFRCAK